MSTLKDELLKLFEGKNTKSYGRLVSCRPELSAKISDHQEILKTESISETLWCIINDQYPPLCGCGTIRKFNTYPLGYRDFCSTKNGRCDSVKQNQSDKITNFWNENPEIKEQMVKKRDQTVMEVYGVSHTSQAQSVKDKSKETNLAKYGVEYPLQSKVVQDKCKSTIRENYGVDYPFQSLKIRQKAEDSFSHNNPGLTDKMQLARDAYIKEHGVNPFAVDSVKTKITDTRMAKYGYKHALQKHLSQEIIDILEDPTSFSTAITGLTIGEASIKLGVNESTIIRRANSYECRDILVTAIRSKWEYKMTHLLLSLGLQENVDFIRGDRTILKGKELDFYFPRINSAIEVGSVFFHSEISSGRGEKYHHDKWRICKENGIDLFQYWDYEMESKWDVITAKVKYIFNLMNTTIGARKITKICKVPLIEEREFLEKNHIQGFGQDRMLAFGAYIDTTLVAVLCIDLRGSDIEITRYATNLTSNYPGLFSRMLKTALKTIGDCSGKRLVSFSDNRHSSGNVYAKSGFTPLKKSLPEYYYTKNYHSVERKKKFTKSKIHKKFNIAIEGKTEWQLMQELGYDRIWDAGKQFWIMDL